MGNLAMIAALSRKGDGDRGREMGMRHEPMPEARRYAAYDMAPMDRMGYPDMGMRGGERYDRYPEAHYGPYVPPYSRPYPRYSGEEPDDEPEMMADNITPIDAYRRIGFGEARRGQPRWQNGRFKPRGASMHYGGEEEDEPHQMRFGGVVGVSQEGSGKNAKLTKAQAEEWVEGMENDNEQHPKGGIFSWEMAKDWAQKVGIQPVGQRMIDFYAAMNAMYSDYSSVAAKYKVDAPEFYAHMAKAFIDDPDAIKNKTAMYYKCIVEK